jgi:hypothetical protein
VWEYMHDLAEGVLDGLEIQERDLEAKYLEKYS